MVIVMISSFLKKIAVEIEKKQNNMFTYPVAKQQKYVNHFPEPRDYIERGYFQYCCQMKLYGEPLHMFLNLASYPVLIYYLIKFKKIIKNYKISKDALFFNEGKPANIIPLSLQRRYNEIILVDSSDSCLSNDDFIFLKNIFKKYKFSGMFLLKIVLKIAQYSGAITKYSPKVIISCDEFSFTEAILTEYCHTRGVKSINVMHGEKLYFMRDSFIRYDEFFVWSKEYVDLFISLRAYKNQFKIEAPPSLKISPNPLIKKKYDYTYYLEAEDEKVLKKIKKELMKLEHKGYRISTRPHPRYSNMKLVNYIFKDINIEDVELVSIESSILQTKNVISVYSSVLNQAYHSGVDIVVDDVTRPWLFKKIKELKYIILETNPKYLSEL